MRKLKRVLKIAKLSKRDPEMVLSKFLAAYHDTPHTATGVAPNMLLFGHARTSGLPIIESLQEQNRQTCHREARERYRAYVDQMKLRYDEQMRTRECPIRIGDLVLCRQSITNKSDSAWDPDPFVVVSIKGSMIEASRAHPKRQSVARNSSFFKIYMGWSEPEMVSREEALVQDTAQPSSLAEAQPSVSPSTVTMHDVAADHRPTPPLDARKAGRPTKEQSRQIQQQREAIRASELASNPPTRKSARLAEKVTKEINAISVWGGGKILCRDSSNMSLTNADM
jgi:hypothetical protein